MAGWGVARRQLGTCGARLGRFKWYNIRKPAADVHQADPMHFENLALSLQPQPGYIDRLGEIWFEMVATARDVNFKRDDFFINRDMKRWLPAVDGTQPRIEYRSVNELLNAPESVKKIFSVDFGHRKDLTACWKQALMDEVRKHDLDNDSLEGRIAKHTALIRQWTRLLTEMKRKPGWLRQSIFISIQHRRKLLRLLREENEESFRNVLKRLQIAYYVSPLPEDERPITRKGWVEYIVRKKIELIKEERLRKYDESLKEAREDFILEKERTVKAYDEEKRRINEELKSLQQAINGETFSEAREYPGHTIDQISENSIYRHYYRSEESGN